MITAQKDSKNIKIHYNPSPHRGIPRLKMSPPKASTNPSDLLISARKHAYRARGPASTTKNDFPRFT